MLFFFTWNDIQTIITFSKKKSHSHEHSFYVHKHFSRYIFKKPVIFAFVLSGLMFTMKEMFEGKQKLSYIEIASVNEFII